MKIQQFNSYIEMNEEQKSRQASQQGQSLEQLQALLKETMKENKSLQNKHSKLEAKYVEVFKQTKGLKKDYAVFTSFFNHYFNGEGNVESEGRIFQEQAIGQYQLNSLRIMGEQKQQGLKLKLRDLEIALEKNQKDSQTDLKRLVEQNKREIVEGYESKLKSMSEQRNKEVTNLLKELDHLKKTNKQLHDETSSLTKTLQQKNNELSKANKEKLKLEHHLNNIRKKEIAEELSPQKQKQQEKLMNERNQFLSLRQQVESLMAKRDQLKHELKENQMLLAKERRKNEVLEDEISKLKRSESEMNEKYELIRQCTLEQLETMILTHHFGEAQSNGKSHASIAEPVPHVQINGQESEQIQKQYLKNVLLRYIKAEISGTLEQSIMLLQVIANILKLDPQTYLALENYKVKRKQWWYIKY